MPRLDRYHECVRRALIKDGWEISYDPLMIYHKGTRVYLDLAAERVIGDALESVAIEVKVFGGKSRQTDFEHAVGQYDLYRTVLMATGNTRELYLALPQTAWMKLQALETLLLHLRIRKIDLLIFDPHTEEVIAWIKQPN